MKIRLLGLASVLPLLLLSSAPARASLITYEAILDGPSESPANASPATGFVTLIIDDIANTMEVQANFTDLLGTTTASHIHCCTVVPGTGTASVATVAPAFPGFPLGVMSGTYDHVLNLLDTSTYLASFLGAHGGTAASAEAFLLAGLAADEAYFNIHTTTVPGGEIRGFLQLAPAAVPEPATLSLLGLGLAIGGLKTWRARRSSAI